MKTLYKSILDDEEALMSNSIKDSQNPLLLLHNLYKQYKSFEKISDKDIRRVITSMGLPNYKNLVIGKNNGFIRLYDQSITNITKEPVVEIYIGYSRWTLNEKLTAIFIDLEEKKSIINKFFGGKKKYDEFCKKMWDWEFVQPNYWRFYYNLE